MSKVSVIMPAFNAAKYISQSILSVCNQTFMDWELIIVDDCSTDNTYQIALEHSSNDNRIVVFKNETNCGVAMTRNRALKYARSDYIAFLDSDDVWLPDKLKKQLEFMQQNNYVLTYTSYQKFDSISNEKGKIICAPQKITANQIYGDTSIGCLTVMINRKEVGEFSMPNISHCEDNCTWQEILSRGYIAYGLNETLALYRDGNKSLTNSKIKAVLQQWKIYRNYYKFSIVKSAFYFWKYAVKAFAKHYL